MLNKIRIVVFRGLKVTPEAHISMLLPSNRRISDVPWASRAINRLRASIRVPIVTEQRKNSCASFFGQTAVARLAVLEEILQNMKRVLDLRIGCWP